MSCRWEFDELIQVKCSNTSENDQKTIATILRRHRQLEKWWILRNSCNIINSPNMLTRSQKYLSNQRSKPLYHHDHHQSVVEPKAKESHCPQGAYNLKQMTQALTNMKKGRATDRELYNKLKLESA